MGDKYILDKNGKPVLEPDLRKWAVWFGSAQNSGGRTTALTDVGKYEVSTVFLALDYSFGGNEPVLYETMVFEKGSRVNLDDEGFFARYHTKEEALKGHKHIVGWVKKKLGITSI